MLKSGVLGVLLTVGFLSQSLNTTLVTDQNVEGDEKLSCTCPATTPHSFIPFPAYPWITVTSDPTMDKHNPGGCTSIVEGGCISTDTPLCEAQRRFIVKITLGPGESLLTEEFIPPFGWIPEPVVVGPAVKVYSYVLSTVHCNTSAEKLVSYSKNTGDIQMLSMKASCGICNQNVGG